MKRYKMQSHENKTRSVSSETPKTQQLPPLAIDKMTRTQLKNMIPQLVRLSCGQRDLMSNKGQKPDWWPPDVPWSTSKSDLHYQEVTLTENLREIVKSCYKHLGQENLLKDSSKPCRSDSPMMVCTMPRSSPVSGYTPKFSEIYVCYFCEEEFANREDMYAHQANCMDKPPLLHEMPLTPPPIRSDIREHPPQMSPVKVNLHDNFTRTSRDIFVKYMNLVPKQKAERIRARTRRSMDVECEEIDVSEPDTPISPSTPRTPKLLISQLSREDSTCNSKKRLSYSEGVDNEDKESVISGCSEDSDDKPANKGKSLLTIDITSLLGQRIQKHVKSDSTVQVVEDSENFCKTPIKNQFYEKLRNRTASYPISYKPRKKYDTRHSHNYCFTSRQKRERKAKLATGLNKRGRELARKIKPCKVIVAKLTKKELKRFLGKKWYENNIQQKKKVVIENSKVTFPKEPILLSKEIDQLLGLKKKSDLLARSNRSPLSSLAAMVSEDDNAEASKQKFTLYRCLLKDFEDSKNSKGNNVGTQKKTKETSVRKSRAEKKPMEDKIRPQSPSGQECSTPKLPPSPVSPPESLVDYKIPRHSRMSSPDSSISIFSLESDEESLKSGCCMACRNRKGCRCTPNGSRINSPEPIPSMQGKSLPSTVFVPLSVPLHISPGSLGSGSPQMSPCSTHPSPRGELLLQKSLPSPASSIHSHSSSEIDVCTVDGLDKDLITFKTPSDTNLLLQSRAEKRHSNVLSPTSASKSNMLEGKQLLKPLITHPERLSMDARTQRVLRRRSTTENVDTNNIKNNVSDAQLLVRHLRPTSPNVIPWNNTCHGKKKVSVIPIRTDDSITKDSVCGNNSNADIQGKSAAAKTSVCLKNGYSSADSNSDIGKSSQELGETRRSRTSINCNSCLACNSLLFDKTPPPSSPLKQRSLCISDDQVSLTSGIQTRTRTGSVSSPIKRHADKVKSAVNVSPTKKTSVMDLENKTSRRSKRLLSGSLQDSGSPYKMRRIETM